MLTAVLTGQYAVHERPQGRIPTACSAIGQNHNPVLVADCMFHAGIGGLLPAQNLLIILNGARCVESLHLRDITKSFVGSLREWCPSATRAASSLRSASVLTAAHLPNSNFRSYRAPSFPSSSISHANAIAELLTSVLTICVCSALVSNSMWVTLAIRISLAKKVNIT